MALTRDFKQTVLARVLADPEFRDALLKECSKPWLARDGRLQQLQILANRLVRNPPTIAN
jgi:hypothetical protein